jgi:hypothetical protein
MNLIHADGVVSGPFAVVEAVAKGKGSLVECGSDWHLVPSNLAR